MRFLGLSASGEPALASDFIPTSHAHLRVLRLFLPWGSERGLVRWSSELAGVASLNASTTWADLKATTSSVRAPLLLPRPGLPGDQVASALRQCIGSLSLTAASWIGYGEVEEAAELSGVDDFMFESFTAERVFGDARLPEFVWDDQGEFAWGSRIYADSLVIAADAARFRALHRDPRLDVVSVIRQQDMLPGSAFD